MYSDGIHAPSPLLPPAIHADTGCLRLGRAAFFPLIEPVRMKMIVALGQATGPAVESPFARGEDEWRGTEGGSRAAHALRGQGYGAHVRAGRIVDDRAEHALLSRLEALSAALKRSPFPRVAAGCRPRCACRSRGRGEVGGVMEECTAGRENVKAQKDRYDSSAFLFFKFLRAKALFLIVEWNRLNTAACGMIRGIL